VTLDDELLGPWMQVSAPIWYGNSGGGAFDAEGSLVGIASFKALAPNVAFYVHLETIREFLLS
jgi:S1-C subfamily serine protease